MAAKQSRKILDIFHTAPNKVFFFTAATLGAGGGPTVGVRAHMQLCVVRRLCMYAFGPLKGTSQSESFTIEACIFTAQCAVDTVASPFLLLRLRVAEKTASDS